MEISQRKMDANQHNAQESTGPRTEEGKARSRWNALKHGLTAKTMLLPDMESAKAYEKLLLGYRRTFRPKGVVEESLVQQLAALYQTVMRGFHVERNEFQRTSDWVLLPEPATMQSLTRYQTSNDRRFKQCLTTLNEVQRARRKKERRQKKKKVST